ncbi:MAG: acetyl/propionyl/methylcrotonyl-CoA carboxylase subunit alpha [Methylobacteriaceae bacterium]|nr:acetyl/propionyl/methylcrotonyl-CoA carboxylase subunit alpha [Methylobacteriaceae bacterium]
MTTFSKILIANRGEIACRVMRTARDMGYRTVAVYSDADADALHVREADEAVRIGPPPVSDSYLNVQAILDAAKRVGADAVHPGYGFLSENDGFASACQDAGLVFIGPTPEAIRAMGNKAAAKRLMIEAGVPCVPGYQGADQSDAALAAEAQRIGCPIMVKAAAGGGGRGMRLVTRLEDFADAVSTARSEAQNAFGSGELILEKAVVDARHVEVQVFGDAHGHVIHLGERDCSAQRRHQKVIEEAPSPAVSPALREKMGAAAVAAAKAISYRGAGTVEFLLGADGEFYFLEMNTRLQVEHPVTEEITGLDLVEWQLRVAAGEPLPLKQEDVRLDGHAIEVRLYAESPEKNFLPQSGTVFRWMPASGKGVRVDHGIRSGQEISPFYDPMIAKVIAHGRTREEARRRLVRALEETVLFGLPNNKAFLVALLGHRVFATGETTTGFIPTHFAVDSAAMAEKTPSTRLLALAAALLYERSARQLAPLVSSWDSSGVFSKPLKLATGEKETPVSLSARGVASYSVSVGGETIDLDLVSRDADRVRFAIGGAQSSAAYAFDGATLHVESGGEQLTTRETSHEIKSAADRDGGARLLAPMNGRIVSVLAQAGETVKKGQRIVVLEAMKMQHEIVAGRDGVLEAVSVKEGDQVATRHVLATLAAEDA